MNEEQWAVEYEHDTFPGNPRCHATEEFSDETGARQHALSLASTPWNHNVRLLHRKLPKWKVVRL